MGSVWTQPSPSDVDRAAQRIANGEPISEACQAEGFTLTQLRQCDRQAWAELKSFWHDVQGVEDRTTARETFREIATSEQAEARDRVNAAVQLAKSSGYLSERVEVVGDGGGPVQIEQREVSLHGVLHILAEAGALDDVDLGALAGARPLLPPSAE